MYQVPDQSGRIVVVTGATSGLGREAARRLAAAGARVVLAVRDVEAGALVRDEITATVGAAASVEVCPLDLASLASVRECAEHLQSLGRPIDTLVNNAGVMAPPQRLETADGFELQWGTNALGPFALTMHLLPSMLQGPAPRVVMMSSGTAAFGKIRFHDLDWVRGYLPARAYAQSKLANLLMGLRLAEVAARRGWMLRSTVAHPGYTRTNLHRAGAALGDGWSVLSIGFPGVPKQDVDTGAEPLLYAAADPGALNGAYYGPNGPMGLSGPTARVELPRVALQPSLGRSFWAVAEHLTGTHLPD